jgi:hypothetical protein
MALNHNSEEQHRTLAAADASSNFFKIYERLPPNKKEPFRSAMFKLQRRYPNVWVRLFSNDEKESAAAYQWLKERTNELASQFGQPLGD